MSGLIFSTLFFLFSAGLLPQGGEMYSKRYVPCPRRQRCSGPIIYSGSTSLGLSPGQGHCVEFLGETLYFHSASLIPPRYTKFMGTGKFNAGGNPAMD